MAEKTGIYIHIPFCKSKCDYCDFYSLVGKEERMDEYLHALVVHLKETAKVTRGHAVDSIYIGGGTPSIFGEKRIRTLLTTIRRHFDVERDGEITMECNPDSVDKGMLRHIRHSGVNRISMGVQSAHDGELMALHRAHTFRQAQLAVTAAREAKIKNISLDLMYGLPGQTMESWQSTVEQVLALEPEHLSCYGLKVESGTPLDGRVIRGEQLPDDDVQADMYLWVVEELARRGYPQYEISNFSRTGYQSNHNLRYWMGRPYLGFGAGAHSDFGGRRFSFVKSMEDYIEGVLGGGRIVDESNITPHKERGSEYIMLRLRTSCGIEEWEYRREHFMNFEPLAQKLSEYERHGWATCVDNRWRLTPTGFLISNTLIGELLSLQEGASWTAHVPQLK